MDVTISPLTEAEAKQFSARNQWLDHTRATAIHTCPRWGIVRNMHGKSLEVEGRAVASGVWERPSSSLRSASPLATECRRHPPLSHPHHWAHHLWRGALGRAGEEARGRTILRPSVSKLSTPQGSSMIPLIVVAHSRTWNSPSSTTSLAIPMTTYPTSMVTSWA
jgi:hypothetical protein